MDGRALTWSINRLARSLARLAKLVYAEGLWEPALRFWQNR